MYHQSFLFATISFIAMMESHVFYVSSSIFGRAVAKIGHTNEFCHKAELTPKGTILQSARFLAH